MQVKKLLATVALAMALGAPAAPLGTSLVATAEAAPVQMAHMSVTKTGTFEKLTSSTSFVLKVGMKSYTVKVNDMTHITHNGMKEKLSSLKKGQELTVNGQLEMGTIIATSVVVGM